MQELYRLLLRVAPAQLPVLLLGETGCGKEVLAETLHRSSLVAGARLVKINCAGLTESVVESELFGHERGAFTGAVQARAGVFEQASGGSLFLDEVAELSLRTQAKLLRVLESGEFCRVGGHEVRRARVRIIAATHPELVQRLRDGEFRRDLYYRLCGMVLEIPALRERICEIMPLARRFLARTCAELGRATPTLLPCAGEVLNEHPWPGNLRELRNAMERVAVTCLDPEVSGAWLKPHLRTPDAAAPIPETMPACGSAEGSGQSLRGTLRDHERRQIVEALQRSGGNQTHAAELLGISRRTLSNKLNVHAIERPRRSRRATSAPRRGDRGAGAARGWSQKELAGPWGS